MLRKLRRVFLDSEQKCHALHQNNVLKASKNQTVTKNYVIKYSLL